MKISNLQKKFLEKWIREYRFNPYRNYPDISKEDALKLLSGILFQETPDVHYFWAGSDRKPTGFLRVKELKRDEEIYKFKMGFVTHAGGDIKNLNIQKQLGKAGYRHIATRVDMSETELFNRFVSQEFFLVESFATYLFSKKMYNGSGVKLPETKSSFTCRKYKPEDRKRILSITRRMYSHYPGRHYRDPLLREHSAERYLRWTEEYFENNNGNIYVAESNGKVTAFLMFRTDRDILKIMGKICYGSGIGASIRGEYSHLLYECIRQGISGVIPVDYAEFETQLDNYSVLSVYQRLNLMFARAQYTLHLHLV